MSGERSNGSTLWGGAAAWPTGPVEVPRPELPHTTSPDDVRWTLRYERASVDRFLAETEAECSRLQAEIDVARAQRDAARQVIATREREAQATLGALVFAAEREMTELETAHQAVITTIREAAETEAARVREAARREATALRQAAVTLAPLVDGRAVRTFTSPAGHPAADRPRTTERVDAG